MGAWGTGPFQNDEALDFVAAVEEAGRSGRLGALGRPLEHVVRSGDYLIAPDVTEAVAAAGVVGAVLNPTESAGEPGLPEWAAQVPPERLDNELVELARRALRRALQPHDNEAYELWAEAGADAQWQDDVRRVLGWLGDRDD
ncbi:DUF4259 domain-containing protein [Nostocoides sp. F2B08]|uniref:DUF4259 domain-containing protein n=1 Tax=Nostocoides sp. F2B08 TaxID=2653936 RepID=UPI001263AA5D|nr:DUF4259 domain-containing protein [Tetrasphaera sp. F2B08]KAB7739801.1 DUF4259 domain-containing protein [Tetrasphaera sp. F2B08]